MSRLHALADGQRVRDPARRWYAKSELTTLTLSHVWVKVNIGGTFYAFDPSYKDHTVVAGGDLGTAMGYNSTTLHEHRAHRCHGHCRLHSVG